MKDNYNINIYKRMLSDSPNITTGNRIHVRTTRGTYDGISDAHYEGREICDALNSNHDGYIYYFEVEGVRE